MVLNLRVYTFQLSSEIRDKLNYYIKFVDMLTNSIDYNSYLAINSEASKRGFPLTFKSWRD
jgi:hypothetical protein